jgi:hypothetical protein
MEKLELMIIYAKTMIKLGFAIRPVGHGEKPSIHNPTKDPKKFEKYIHKHPDCNYVAATGKVSGVFVVSMKGAIGEANLLKIAEAKGRLPATMVICTDEGADFYFAMPNTRVPNCQIADGVEVHGDDGFVYGPGSEHPSGMIEFIPGYLPGEVEIPPGPNWLLQTITTVAEIRRLSQLSAIDYDRERDEAAKRLKCRKTVLDQMVQQARNESRPDASNRGIVIAELSQHLRSGFGQWWDNLNGTDLSHQARQYCGLVT